VSLDEDEIDAGETSPLLGTGEKSHRYVVKYALTLRKAPRLDAERTGEILKAGEVFEAHDIVTVCRKQKERHWDHVPLDSACFVSLGGDRGWALNRHVSTDRVLLEEVVEDLEGVSGWRHSLRQLFLTSAYEYAILLVILLNAVSIGQEVDHLGVLQLHTWVIINTIFATIYVLEIGLKMFAFGPMQFAESSWNLMDFSVIALTLIGELAAAALGRASVVSAVSPVLRLLRLLRLMKFFRGLRILMRSFSASMRPLIWIAMCMLMWFYISACAATVFIGRKEWLKDSDIDGQPHYRDRFKSIGRSMYTLFEVMTLEGWTEVVQPLSRTRPDLVLCFILFVFIAAFVLLNLVTAVVVDQTVNAQMEDELETAASRDDGMERVVYDLTKQLQRRNRGQDIALRSDLEDWLKEPDSKHRLEKLEWDAELAEAACAVMDRDKTGNVSLQTLQKIISATMRPVDMIAVLRMEAMMTRRLEKQEEILRQLLDNASR